MEVEMNHITPCFWSKEQNSLIRKKGTLWEEYWTGMSNHKEMDNPKS